MAMCVKLSEHDRSLRDRGDEATDSECLGHSCDEVLSEAAPTAPPHFSVVHWWLNEVEGRCIGDHMFVARLGEGAYGRVYASPDAAGGMSAVKVMSKSRLGEDRFEAIAFECDILSQLRHPNICAFKGTLNGCQNFYIFMEFAGPSSLYSILYRGGSLGRSQTQRVFPDILQGVDYMHSRGIAHRDLKPANIVISPEGIPKIVDFGLAVWIGSNNSFGPYGTFPFIPPEAILKEGKAYDLAKGDMWSLGFVLLEAVCGVDKVSRMLGWEQNAALSMLGVMQLISFLTTAKALENAVRLEVGRAAGKLAPTLHSLTCPMPEHRWDTKEALTQIQQGTWI